MGAYKIIFNVYNPNFGIGHINITLSGPGYDEIDVGLNTTYLGPSNLIYNTNPAAINFLPSYNRSPDGAILIEPAAGSGLSNEYQLREPIEVTAQAFDKFYELALNSIGTADYHLFLNACIDYAQKYYDELGYIGSVGNLFPPEDRNASALWLRMPFEYSVEYQNASASFYGALSEDGLVSTAVSDIFALQSASALTNYSAEQLTPRYRQKVAERFDDGLSSASAYQTQVKSLTAKGYTFEQAAALAQFREAYKFSPNELELAAMADQLYDFGLTQADIPDPYSETWSFCFADDTAIMMGDGSVRRIDKIEVGDEVMAFSEVADGGRGPLVPRRVARLFRKLTDEWIKLSNGVSVTPGHFFQDHALVG